MFSNAFICATDNYAKLHDHLPAPLFRRSFVLDSTPKSGVITIGAPNFYRLFINGTDVTKGLLAPYINNPDDFIYYDEYDVTPYLHKGENVIGVILGNGIQNCMGGQIWAFHTAIFRGALRFALALEAETEGGAFLLESDTDFVCHPSPYEFDDLRFGVRYDATKELPGWNRVGFDTSDWTPALSAESPRGEKRLCEAEPIVCTGEEIAPVSITYVGDGFSSFENHRHNAKTNAYRPYFNAYLYDFGTNAAGIFRLKIRGKQGQKIKISFGDMLFDGRFTLENISFQTSEAISELYAAYNQTAEFICSGKEDVFTPDFTYYGYRYALVEGLEEGQATADLLTYLVANSDLARRSHFACSDEMTNQLYECAVRSDYSNFYYFPTDCPHREKNGWTGDAAMSAEQMSLTMDTEKSYREWMRSVCAAQDKRGALPGIVPTSGWGFHWGNGPVWDSVIVYLPYASYQYNGDKAIILESAQTILRYFAYLETRLNDRGLIEIGLNGDWCMPDRWEVFPLPLEVSDTMTVYDMTQKAAFLFDQVGWISHADFARRFGARLYDNIRTHLIDFSTMEVAGHTQTGQAIALNFGLFTEEERPRAQKVLLDLIHEKNDHLACGMLGIRNVFHAVAEAGEVALAHQMIVRPDRPSLGFMVANGATTLWEDMAALDDYQQSKNHHFFGDILNFFFRRIAGLRPNPNCTDLKEFLIAPAFDLPLTWACADYLAKEGKVEVKWKKAEDTVTLTVSVPDGIYGKIALPQGYVFADGTAAKDLASGSYLISKK